MWWKLQRPRKGSERSFLAFEVMTTTGRFLAFNGLVDFDDVEGHLVEHVEHVVLEVRVGLVDLVDEQHRLGVGHEGLADLAHPDVGLDVAHVALRVAEAAVVEAREGVVLVEGLDELHARLHVQGDERQVEALGDGVGEHRLSRARLALQQKGHLQGDGDVHDLGQFLVEDVFRGAAEGVGFLFLFFHLSLRCRFSLSGNANPRGAIPGVSKSTSKSRKIPQQTAGLHLRYERSNPSSSSFFLTKEISLCPSMAAWISFSPRRSPSRIAPEMELFSMTSLR